MGEVMEALKAWQPHLLVQFEDFGEWWLVWPVGSV
jgi:hypothetical protein